MAAKKSNITIPTGYEAEQRKIERKQKIADALMARGLQPQSGMQSWTQVLGSLASAGIGKHLEGRAGKREDALNERILGDYKQQRGDFQADVDAGMPVKDLIRKHGSNQLLGDDLDPYREAFAGNLKGMNEVRQIGNRFGTANDLHGGAIPGKPTDKVIETDRGWEVNPVAVSADLLSNPLPPGAKVSGITPNMANPYGGGPLGGGPQAAPPLPAQAAPTAGAATTMGGGPIPPEQRGMVAGEIAKRNPGAAVPFGDPTQPPNAGPQVPPPAGVFNGKPAWQVNGKWYDNPAGN